MATPGFEPYQTLWHLFHQTTNTMVRPLIELERKNIASIVQQVTEHNLHPKDSSLVGRFMKLMDEKTGKKLDVEQADLVQGLLECLNPYQAYEPYSNPETMCGFGIYDHFKGGVYKVKGFSSWESGNREKVVEYDSMIYGTPHTRLATQWCEVTRWPDGKYRSRFVYRGPDLHTPEPSYKVPSPK